MRKLSKNPKRRVTTLVINDDDYNNLRAMLKHRELTISAWIRSKIAEELRYIGTNL